MENIFIERKTAVYNFVFLYALSLWKVCTTISHKIHERETRVRARCVWNTNGKKRELRL